MYASWQVPPLPSGGYQDESGRCVFSLHAAERSPPAQVGQRDEVPRRVGPCGFRTGCQTFSVTRPSALGQSNDDCWFYLSYLKCYVAVAFATPRRNMRSLQSAMDHRLLTFC